MGPTLTLQLFMPTEISVISVAATTCNADYIDECIGE